MKGDTWVGFDFICKNRLEKLVSYKQISLFGLSVTDASVELARVIGYLVLAFTAWSNIWW